MYVLIVVVKKNTIKKRWCLVPSHTQQKMSRAIKNVTCNNSEAEIYTRAA